MTRLTPPMLAFALTLVACQAAPTPPAPGSVPAALQAVRQIKVGAAPHGITAAGGFVYNADTGAAQVSVIDTATQAVATTLPFEGGKPGYLKAFHDGRHVLAADTGKGMLRVLAVGPGHPTLQAVPVGKGIDKFVIAGDDRTVHVSLTDEAQVVELQFGADRAAAPTRKTYAVGDVAGAQFKHRALAAGAGWLVAPNSAQNDTSLINLKTGAAERVGGGNNPGPVGLGTVGEAATAAIVGFKASNSIGLYELPGLRLHRLDEVGLTPSDVAVAPGLGRAYVTMSGSNDVAVVDYVGKRLVGRVPVGQRPVHLYLAPPLGRAGLAHAAYGLQDGPAGTAAPEVWVGNDDGGSVTVFDGQTLRVKATIATGAGHHKMAFSGGFAYVSNLTDATVSVIDRTALP